MGTQKAVPEEDALASSVSEQGYPLAAEEKETVSQVQAESSEEESASEMHAIDRGDVLSQASASREGDSSSETESSQEPATLFDSQYENLSLEEKLDVLRERFPDGKYWNYIGYDISDMTQEEACMIVTDEPCDHAWNGYEYCHEYDGRTLYEYTYDYNIQCLGFASMISDFLFGKDAEIETFYEFEDLAVGDQVRFLNYEHSMVVIEKGEDYIKVVECNRDYENCEIEWGRELSRDEVLYDWASYEFLRRVTY